MNKFYLFLLTLFVSIGVSQSASATVWINITGEYNGWQDNGVELNASTSTTPSGYTVHKNIQLGNTKFKVRMYNTNGGTEVWYGYTGANGAIPMNQWVQLTAGGGDETNFFIDGSYDGRTYDVYWDDNTHRIKVVDAGTPSRLYVIGSWNNWAVDEKYSADYINDTGVVNNVPVGNGEFKVLLQPLEIYYTTEGEIAANSNINASTTTNPDAKGTTIKSSTAKREYDIRLTVYASGFGLIRAQKSVDDNYFKFTLYNADGSVYYSANYEFTSANKSYNVQLPYFDHSFYAGVNFGYGEKFYGKHYDEDNEDMYWNGASKVYYPREGFKTPFTVSNAVDGWTYNTYFKFARNNTDYSKSKLTSMELSSCSYDPWYYKTNTMDDFENIGVQGGSFRYVAHTAGEQLRLRLGAQSRTIDPNGGDALISDNITRARLFEAADGKTAILTLAEAATYYFNIERINPDDPDDEFDCTVWTLSVEKRPVIQNEGWSYSVNDGPRQPAINAPYYNRKNQSCISYGFAGLVKQGDKIQFFLDDEPVSILDESDFVISEAYDGYRAYEYVVDQTGSFIIHKPGAVVGENAFYLTIAFGSESIQIDADQKEQYKDLWYEDYDDNLWADVPRARIFVEDYREHNWTYIRYNSGIGAKDISYHHNNQTPVPFEREGDDR
ncbi:MAG: hypothetical protein K2G64_08240, partial [Muribaculaceae bacterium]|nr:hypothetical protein [Muribaculaceae bacterium]